ncbi:hypothetical protein JD844_014481 [Phrynosoma platyrhinos]|uniref:Fibronectin type-III domain-containing protein n=1 Tax=Phrynosoma platyrhinos TaxID=52577 RepID=A0ABQ7SRP4_PHRPL|nr:hypothetical protein JD844_014481 [Phrynosoma platyrhinos]
MVSLLLLIQEALLRTRLATSIPVTPMESQSEGNEPEGPRLYHLELCDSTEDLEMFSEPFQRRDLAVQENRKTQSPQTPTVSTGDSWDQNPDNETASKENDHDDLKTVTSYNTENKEPFKGMDTYCITCCVPVRALDTQCSEHAEHEVIPLVSVVQIAKDELQKNICKLENQIIHLENFSSHLEEIFITVESLRWSIGDKLYPSTFQPKNAFQENFAREEHNLERRYDNMMQTLEQRYEETMQALGEEKKEKLEALYEQLVSCGENLDICKELMETIEDLGQGANKVDTIQVEDCGGLESPVAEDPGRSRPPTAASAAFTVPRLEKFLKKDLDVDLSTPTDYEARVIDFSDVQQLMDSVDSLPAPLPPCAPVINPQDPNSATGTSVRVCWSFFSEDLVESYQLSYKRISNDTSKEEQAEFMLHVKVTYCTVTNLAPNTQYEFWVKALNRAGVSSSSERAVYMTAPLPPVIKSKAIQSCEHAALVCWECGNTNPVDSYTVELSRLTDGGEENFITESIVGIPNCETLVQLEPQQKYLISVRAINTVDVDENIEYRVGVAFENASRDSYLGMNHSSWCMRHTVIASRYNPNTRVLSL